MMHWRAPALAVATAAIALTVSSVPGVAGERDIWRSDNAASLDIGTAYLDYGETVGGATLDSEEGWLPTVQVGIGLLANGAAPIPNLYLHANAGMSRGYTTYSGALCDETGHCIPYRSSTDDRIFMGAVRAGIGVPLSDPVLLVPFVEVGYRYWERRGEGVGGYVENYQNWHGLAGLMVQYSPLPRWVASLSAAGGTTFAASMDAPEPPSGNFTLGNKPAYRLEGKLGYRFAANWELSGTAAFDDFGFGASAVDAAGYYEPDSTTQETTLLMGISYLFF